MKILMMITALALSALGFPQEKENNHSKWTEVRNGSRYKMEVVEELHQAKAKETPHIAFTIEGDLSLLEKVAFVQKGKLINNLSLSKNAQDINVAPGTYLFKFYHKKMGEKEFEVNLKKGDDKVVKLSLK